jgi:indolepyruvate ferredoxin oxidoreductase
VARYLFKLMAYKDEYEVARLHTDKAFTDKIAAHVRGRLQDRPPHGPAPHGQAQRQGRAGQAVVRPLDAPGLGVLGGLKGLRGGALDIFGKTEERRMERALIQEYRACIEELLAGLTPERLALAAEIARIPEDIRGYGHVKERHLKAARAKWDGLMAQWRAPAQRQVA